MKPFGKVTKSVLTSKELSVGAKALYSLLCCYMNTDRECWPGNNKLASELHCSPRQLQRWMHELTEKKIIFRYWSPETDRKSMTTRIVE